MSTEQLLNEAMTEFSNRNFNRSIKLCTKALSESPESDEGIACRMIRASSYELVESSDRMLSLSNAIEDYYVLTNKSDWIRAIGHAGLARTLYFQDAESNAEKIRTHADIAIKLSGHVPSMVVAGAVARDHALDDKLARQYFFMAAKARDYWGLKNLSMSLAMKFSWLSLVVIAPVFYLLIPFFKKRDQPFDD